MIRIKLVYKVVFIQMHQTVQNLLNIKSQIKSKINELKYNNYYPKIIAVSKTFPINHIMPLIESGHTDFGENKVQEALEKWFEIKNDKIKLHLVGKLQTNKVKIALKIFDYIHSLDNLKLAKKISEEQIKYKKRLKIFIQINIANEKQKSGIQPNELADFYKICVTELNLDVVGLMCIPPINDDPKIYFSNLKEIANKNNLKQLSMGMSADY